MKRKYIERRNDRYSFRRVSKNVNNRTNVLPVVFPRRFRIIVSVRKCIYYDRRHRYLLRASLNTQLKELRE